MLLGPVIRLVGGNTYNEGRVEVNYNGEWGTVCNDGWSYTDAGVVCRQLGFGSNIYSLIRFGQGSGPIFLDSVTCNGNELSITNCGHLGVNLTRSCTHSEDVGVRCSNEQGNCHTTSYLVILPNFEKPTKFSQLVIKS